MPTAGRATLSYDTPLSHSLWLVLQLLIWVALYHVADSLQAVSAFLLRCYRVSFTPLALYAVCLWGFGLFGGYRLTYYGFPGGPFFAATGAMQSATGFWIAACAALALVAIALLSLLFWKARRRL